MSKSNPYRNPLYKGLANRIGTQALKDRLSMQVKHSADLIGGHGKTHIHFENFSLLSFILKKALTFSHLENKGTKNLLSYKLTQNTICLKKLPKAFSGFRILHLTDLHIDGLPDRGQKLTRFLSSVNADICVITGDFRFRTKGRIHPMLTAVTPLLRSINTTHGTIGVLGNHDFIEIVPKLEASGIQFLLNESLTITRQGQSITFAGIDDPHFYGNHNLQKALSRIPANRLKILLSHSPEICDQAEKAEIDLMFSGHTHGGQICLPGRIPVFTNTPCQRKFTQGNWQFGKLKGYTSRGIGASNALARFFCPPEIVIHKLIKEK